MPPNDRYLTLEQLRARIGAGAIDTVVLAFTDMQGRLQGKRLHAQYFLDVALASGTEGCNYLLAVDIDMNTVDGYAISSWEKGYGDMEFVPDYDTIRLLPHLEGSVLVQCDLVWLDHAPVPQSPRTILRTQLDRVAQRGMIALAGTELEFIAFDTSYEEAHDRRWRDLTPVNQYNVDYSILGTARVEPLLRDVRNHMYAAGLDVEGAKGECNFGQHEIGFLYAEAMVTADNHSVYKTVAKEIAAQRRAGDHLHVEVRPARGELLPHPPVPARRRRDGGLLGRRADAADGKGARTPLYDHFIAGVLATMRDFTLLYAPNVNSYKRFAAGSFAPTAIAWGLDNRTCAVRAGRPRQERADGEPAARRRREPLPRAGRDAGRRTARHRARAGRWRTSWSATPTPPTRSTCPTPCRPHAIAFHGSAVARAAFGDDVVDHYANMADVELAAFDAAVTDWELAPRVRTDVMTHDDDLINPVDRRARSPSCPRPTGRARTPRSSGPGGLPGPGGAVAPGERGRLLRAVRRPRWTRTVEELAQLEVRNAGHTIGNARWEAGNVRDCLNYYSAAPERLFGRQIPVAGRGRRHLPRAARRRGRRSCRGTSRCRSPAGASRRRSPPATPSC